MGLKKAMYAEAKCIIVHAESSHVHSSIHPVVIIAAKYSVKKKKKVIRLNRSVLVAVAFIIQTAMYLFFFQPSVKVRPSEDRSVTSCGLCKLHGIGVAVW